MASDVGLPTTEAAIAAAEEQLGRRLPSPLRTRLLTDNGGDIVVRHPGGEEEEAHWQLHPVWDVRDRQTMRRSSNHIVKEQELAREWPDFPEHAVAIAQQDGDQLILHPGEDEPRLWFHETGDVEPVEVVWDL